MSHGRAMATIVLLCAIVPVTASAQATVTVAGQVLGPDGDPVEAAEVLVQYRGADDEAANQRALSDAEGRFSFDCRVLNLERAIHVAALKEGLAADWRYVKAGDSVTLTLGAEAAAFSGTVKQPDGTPVEGARVHVHALNRPEDHPISKQLAEQHPELDSIWRDWFFPEDASFLATTTDAAGQFRIAGLPPGDAIRITVETPGYERFRIADKTIPSNTQGYEVVIAAEAIIVGRVTHGGQPVGGLEVQATCEHMWRASTETEEDGSYRIMALGPGRYDVEVIPPEGLVALLGGPVDLEAGQTVTGVDIALTPGGLIEGSVTDGDSGQPVEEATVFANGVRADGHSRTDAEGRFSIRVPPGGYDLHCYPGSGGTFRRTEPMRRSADVAEGGRRAGLDFQVWPDRPRLLRGRVVDVDGRPLVGVRVGAVPEALQAAGETRAPAQRPDDWSDYFATETDAEGRFELPCRAPEYDWADWPVMAMEAERKLAGMALMPAARVPEEPVEIVVERTGWIRGTVTDPDEQPLPDVPIHLHLFPNGVAHGFLLRAGVTDEQGRFSIGPLPPGAVFHVSPGGDYNGKMVGADHVRAEMVRGGDIVLEPIVIDAAGARIVGWVLDEQQKPVEGAIVGITGRNDALTADTEGRFEATGLPLNAKFWVVAVHPTEPLAAAEQIHPAWELEPGLILWPPGGLEGMVVDQKGRPVTGAVVRVWPRLTIDYDDGGQSHVGHAWINRLQSRLSDSGQGVRRTTTDNDGRWKIGGLIGEVVHNVWVDVGDSPVGRAEVEVTAAEVTDAGSIEVELPGN
jgi:protocatechuate 3,4-dioxygenase beta subunit